MVVSGVTDPFEVFLTVSVLDPSRHNVGNTKGSIFHAEPRTESRSPQVGMWGPRSG